MSIVLAQVDVGSCGNILNGTTDDGRRLMEVWWMMGTGQSLFFGVLCSHVGSSVQVDKTQLAISNWIAIGPTSFLIRFFSRFREVFKDLHYFPAFWSIHPINPRFIKVTSKND